MSKYSPISAKAVTWLVTCRDWSSVRPLIWQTKRTFWRPVSEPWKPEFRPSGQEISQSVMIEPLSACSAPPMIRRKVDLPAPFGPSTAMLVRSGMISETSCST